MKRIFFLCFLALASCTVTMAQTTAPTNNQADLKILFNSATSKYDAGILRNNQTMANAGFTEAMSVITNSITQLTQQMNSASSQVNKAAISAKITTQTQLKNDLLALQNNITGNAVTIQNKFGAFKATL